MSRRDTIKARQNKLKEAFLEQLKRTPTIETSCQKVGIARATVYRWIKASAEKIPFPDDHFDYVVCRSLLHHLENPHVGLKEMFRVLKPGGKWSCYDPNHNFVYEVIRSIFQHTDRFSHLHKSFNDRELFNMIEDAGFQIKERRYIGYFGYPLLGLPDIVNFKILISIARVMMWLDEKIAKTWLKKMSWSLMVKAEKL